jgi:hypothetical protein
VAIGDVNPSSFEAYEGIRILIPGAIVVSLYGATVATYAPSATSPASNALAAVVAALLVGLTLLFMDAPVRSAAYRSPDLPDRELRRWNIDVSPYKGYVNLYFVMLDVSFPPMIRNRALYTGAMFRIGFEGIYCVGLTALAVFVTHAAFPAAGPGRGATATTRAVLFAVAGAHVVALLSSLLGWYLHRLQRHDTRREALSAIWRELERDIGAAGLLPLLAGVCALGPFIDTHEPFVGIIAVALPAAAWAVMFLRGRAQPANRDQPRRPLSPPASVLLYGTACAFAAVEAALRIGPASAVDTQWALAWGAASLIPALLIATRGHERKLIGSFRTQTSWMRMNRTALIFAHSLDAAPPPIPGP